MVDKNGVEIQTGMVVEITGAYFKGDNGLWLVERSPGDPSWCSSDHSLKKISKAGKISKAKRSRCFWPIGIFTTDRVKASEALRWNEAHAQIEVVKIANMSEVAAYFRLLGESLDGEIQYCRWNYGDGSPAVNRAKTIKAHYLTVAAKAKGGNF